jgi:TatD DNase family protein
MGQAQPRLIDVHTHTQFAAYTSDYKEVIKRALDNSIWLVNVGTQRDTSIAAVRIAEEYSFGVYAAVGLHPSHTGKSFHDEQELGSDEKAKAFASRGEEIDPDFYIKLGRNKKVVAVGECGLDYYHLDKASKVKQEEALVAQIEVARELGKPLMIHCRSAFQDLIKIFKRESAKLLNPSPGIIHFFTGAVRDAEELKEMGFHFSFGGVTTFARDYDKVIKLIGLERILLETDAPYVAPVPYRGKRNEPSCVKYVAEAVSRIFEVGADEVAAKTTKNAREVLKI